MDESLRIERAKELQRAENAAHLAEIELEFAVRSRDNWETEILQHTTTLKTKRWVVAQLKAGLEG